MTRELKKLFRRANKAIKKTEKAIKKANKLCVKERYAIDKFCERARKMEQEGGEKFDVSHPFADDVLMGGD